MNEKCVVCNQETDGLGRCEDCGQAVCSEQCAELHLEAGKCSSVSLPTAKTDHDTN